MQSSTETKFAPFSFFVKFIHAGESISGCDFPSNDQGEGENPGL